MRLVVPLQGVVQGKGGLLLGSLIPCALFYFLQLYLKRHRSRHSSSEPPSPELPHSPPSRCDSSNRGEVQVSRLAKFLAEQSDSSRDPYDRLRNSNGMIQLGLSENKVPLILIIWFYWIFLG